MSPNLETRLLPGAEQGKGSGELTPQTGQPFTFSLAYQVQSCTDTCKFMAARAGGHPLVRMEDTETTFTELHERVDKSLSILESLSPDCMDGDTEREIIMDTARMGTFQFTAYNYVIKYCIPNFHFHLTTAYCLLRTQGVPLSAFDYMDAEKDLFKKVS